ncbi:MAG: hypothetical protein HWN68_14520 [Desulfobacterales bacterium]|nr:hypothetical protein [Desulfobacterales bacterium]
MDREHGIGMIWPKTLISLAGVSAKSFYRALRGLFNKGLLGTWSESGTEVVEYEGQYAYSGVEYIVFYLPNGMGLEGKVSFLSRNSPQAVREKVTKK